MKIISLTIFIAITFIGCSTQQPKLKLAYENKEINEPKSTENDSIHYCIANGNCFTGIYDYGKLRNLEIQNDGKRRLIAERFGDLIEVIRFRENQNIKQKTMVDSNWQAVTDTLLYETGLIKQVVSTNGGIKDTIGFQVDGKTPTVHLEEMENGDTIEVYLDSAGNYEGEAHRVNGHLVEEKRYKRGGLIFHAKWNGNEMDTLIGDPSKRIRKPSEIMEVVKKEIEELRKIYTSYLKNYSFDTKVRVYMRITPKGDIEEIIPIRFGERTRLDFLRDIILEIGQWKFLDVGEGNTTVTIPFSFSE